MSWRVPQKVNVADTELHRRERTAPRPPPAIADWAGEDLATLRGLRHHPFG